MLKKKLWVLLCLLLLNVVLDVSLAKEKSTCNFTTVFNFGDSNSDTGGLSAAFVPLPWPYGETFFRKTSGRYSDGRLIIDFIAEKLGIPYLSAYLNSLGANYSHGANFATGGATIRQPNETIFQTSISPFPLEIQLSQYDQLKNRSKDLYGDSKIRSMLPKQEMFSKALYTFDIGQNDLAIAIRTMTNDDQIRAEIPKIIAQHSSAIQHLYKDGARSFWIHNTGPIGCLPDTTGTIIIRARTVDQYGCIKSGNDIAREFNRQLNDAVSKLRAELPEAAITYVDVYSAKYGLISQAKSLGLEDPRKICCGVLEKGGRIWCGRKGLLNNGTVGYGGACTQPDRYVSWDGIHYTEAANRRFADLIINGSLSSPSNSITNACHRD